MGAEHEVGLAGMWVTTQLGECEPRHATGGDVLEPADRALYRAKAAGGNRIEV